MKPTSKEGVGSSSTPNKNNAASLPSSPAGLSWKNRISDAVDLFVSTSDERVRNEVRGTINSFLKYCADNGRSPNEYIEDLKTPEFLDYCRSNGRVCKDHYDIFSVFGVHVPKRSNAASSLVNSARRGNWDHIAAATMNRLGIRGHRDEYLKTNVSLSVEEPASRSYNRRSMSGEYNGELDLDIAVIFKGKGTVSYSLTARNYNDIMMETDAAAFMAGGYMSGSIPATFSAINGEVNNHYVDPNMGGFVAFIGGKPRIISLDGMDHAALVKYVQDNNASGFQSHLVMHKGEMKVWENSSPSRDVRRFFVTFKDGSHGFVHFNRNVTLYEATTMLKRSGIIESAVNVDTGGYNHAAIMNKTAGPGDGTAEHLGVSGGMSYLILVSTLEFFD